MSPLFFSSLTTKYLRPSYVLWSLFILFPSFGVNTPNPKIIKHFLNFPPSEQKDLVPHQTTTHIGSGRRSYLRIKNSKSKFIISQFLKRYLDNLLHKSSLVSLISSNNIQVIIYVMRRTYCAQWNNENRLQMKIILLSHQHIYISTKSGTVSQICRFHYCFQPHFSDHQSGSNLICSLRWYGFWGNLDDIFLNFWGWSPSKMQACHTYSRPSYPS